MPLGGQWRFYLGDLVLIISLLLLAIEVIKATYTRGAGLADQALSMILAVICINRIHSRSKSCDINILPDHDDDNHRRHRWRHHRYSDRAPRLRNRRRPRLNYFCSTCNNRDQTNIISNKLKAVAPLAWLPFLYLYQGRFLAKKPSNLWLMLRFPRYHHAQTLIIQGYPSLSRGSKMPRKT